MKQVWASLWRQLVLVCCGRPSRIYVICSGLEWMLMSTVPVKKPRARWRVLNGDFRTITLLRRLLRGKLNFPAHTIPCLASVITFGAKQRSETRVLRLEATSFNRRHAPRPHVNFIRARSVARASKLSPRSSWTICIWPDQHLDVTYPNL